MNKAFLVRWTKGFDVEDAVNKDVCHLLQAEIDEDVSTRIPTMKTKLYGGLKLPVMPLLTIPSSPWLHVLLRTRNVQLGGLMVGSCLKIHA